MCLFGEQDWRIGARGNEKHAPALLGHPIFFGAEYLHIDAIAEAFHTLEYLMHDAAPADRRDAGYVLHHDPTRMNALHDPKILAKQACAWVVNSALVLINRITIARETPSDPVYFIPPNATHL